MNRDFGKKTKGCFSSKARFSAVTEAFCSSSKEIVTAHRLHGVCPARLAAFFSEERGCAALSASKEPGARRSKYFFATRARASFGRPGSTGLEGSAGWLGFVFSLVELPK